MKDRIFQLSKSLGISLNQMSLDLGFTKSYLSQMVGGSKRRLNERAIKLIASTYNVSETWLRTGEGEMFNPPESPTELDQTTVIINFIKNVLEDLNEENRRIVLEAVKQLEDQNFFTENDQ